MCSCGIDIKCFIRFEKSDCNNEGNLIRQQIGAGQEFIAVEEVCGTFIRKAAGM